jgi:excisionase family DNA binding protein
MDEKVLIHCISSEEFRQIIKDVIREELFANDARAKQDENVFLTRDEACAILRINKTTLWKWTKKGRLIRYGIGNRVLYKKNEVIESLIRIDYNNH